MRQGVEDKKKQPETEDGGKSKSQCRVERGDHQTSSGNRSFRVPAESEIPKIPIELRKAPKELASRFFQLASGHAMIAPFVKEKFKWIESDTCWWCGSERQTREHLFKQCLTWKKEIRELWKTAAEMSGCKGDQRGFSCKGRGFFLCWGTGQGRAKRRPGNTSIRELMADKRSTEVVLTFLRTTGVGKLKEGVLSSLGPH